MVGRRGGMFCGRMNRNGGKQGWEKKDFLFSMHYTYINRLSWIICMAKFFDYHSDFNQD